VNNTSVSVEAFQTDNLLIIVSGRVCPGHPRLQQPLAAKNMDAQRNGLARYDNVRQKR
jgi:hypothetical protein